MADLNPRTLGMVMKNLCCILHPSGILNRHFPREAGIHGLWGFLDHPELLALVSGRCLFVCFIILCAKSLVSLHWSPPDVGILFCKGTQRYFFPGTPLQEKYMFVIKLSNSLLAGILCQKYVFLWLQVCDLSLDKCQLLLACKGLSDDSESSTKLFAQFPFQILWTFPNSEFKKANKPQRNTSQWGLDHPGNVWPKWPSRERENEH